MPLEFGFGFNDEDIEVDEDEEVSVARNHGEPPDETPQTANPTLHPLHELTATAINVLPDSVLYSTVQLPFLVSQPRPEPRHLSRRELFDIRAQLMAEDTGTDDSVLAGLSSDDIKPNIYEGGFKTWECSLDLASYISYAVRTQYLTAPKKLHVVELGAGSGLPTLSLFSHLIAKVPSAGYTSIQFTVTDYNESVLHLSTIPNLLINWAIDPSLRGPYSGDLEITQDLQKQFLETLRRLSVNTSAISGGWGSALVDLIMRQHPASTSNEQCETIIMASETIYSRSTIRTFTSTLLDLLKAAKEHGSGAKAFVAAKRVYFGVGGGVDEFMEIMTQMGGEGKVAWKSEGEGVERVIIEVTAVALEAQQEDLQAFDGPEKLSTRSSIPLDCVI